jgi:1,2-diacylglycerol 3-beta-glucosyltransferase
VKSEVPCELWGERAVSETAVTFRSKPSPATRTPDRRRRRRRHVLLHMVNGTFFALEGAMALSTGYLLTLLFAARNSIGSSAGAAPTAVPGSLRLVVLIPAHDEQNGIRATLESLASCRYPSESLRTIVIADNCTDGTADRASDVGAEVWTRHAPGQRGKGSALIWALERLRSSHVAFDAVVILDADCIVSPNMLSAIAERIRGGASAVQVRYMVGNPSASRASALRYAAFALMDTVRPLGKQRLGLSCGLFGTGMGFTSELLDRAPWTATGLAEDGEYHMHLVDAGERAEFAFEATVNSAMPNSFAKSSDQQARWEQGKLQLIRRWSPRLVGTGLARRDLVRIHAGLEQLVPPQSLIAAGSIASALAASLLGSRRLLSLSIGTLTAQLTFVLAGLRLVQAPAEVYRTLFVAPVLVLTKLALYLRLLCGRGPKSWVRTARS